MSEFQAKLDQAFGEAGDLDAVLKQGVTQQEAPGPGEARKQEAVIPKQPEEVVEPIAAETATDETPETPKQTDEEAEAQALAEEDHKPETTHRDTKAEARIAKLIRERERLKGQLDAIRQTNQAARPSEPGQAQIDPDAPNPANYPEGDKDIDFKVDFKLYQRDKVQQQATLRVEQQEMIKKYPDMKELLEMDAERVASGIATANATVMKLIQESDIKGELWHYLLANSDEAIRIAAMDPLRTAKAIGQIEATLAIPALVPEVKPKKPLPPPITPVKPTKANVTAGTKNYGFSEY